MNPQVNSVIHKTHIEVNEKGAVAAAVTGAVVIPLMGTTLEIMNINHPFLFFIRDKNTGAILFGGRVNEPTQYQKDGKNAQASERRRPQAAKQPSVGPIYAEQNPSPQNAQIRPAPSTSFKNPGFNQQDPSKVTNSWNIGKPDQGHVNTIPLSSQSSALNNNHAQFISSTQRPTDSVMQYVVGSGTPLAQYSNLPVAKKPSEDSITFADTQHTY